MHVCMYVFGPSSNMMWWSPGMSWRRVLGVCRLSPKGSCDRLQPPPLGGCVIKVCFRNRLKRDSHADLISSGTMFQGSDSLWPPSFLLSFRPRRHNLCPRMSEYTPIQRRKVMPDKSTTMGTWPCLQRVFILNYCVSIDEIPYMFDWDLWVKLLIP